MTKEADEWTTTLKLEPGRYPYQFVVDGKWMLDPANPDSMDNNAGGFNSILQVVHPDNLPFLRPQKAERGVLYIDLEGEAAGWLVLWEYAELDSNFVDFQNGMLKIQLPKQALDAEKSLLTVLAWNASGRSNDLLVPLHKGLPAGVGDENWKQDWQAMALYFPLVDRFANGDINNDQPTLDERILPPANFFGGDLQGLTQHLDYIQSLGINTLWVSPVAENPKGAYQEYQ